MEFRELITRIVENGKWYEQKHDVTIDMHFAAYNLIKEIGQFADATLTWQGKTRPDKRADADQAKEQVTQELVDIVALAIINADVYGIDLEAEIIKKWVARTGR